MARIRNLLAALGLAFGLMPAGAGALTVTAPGPRPLEIGRPAGDIVLVRHRHRGNWQRHNGRFIGGYRVYRLYGADPRWQGRPMRVIILRRYPEPGWHPARPRHTVALTPATEVPDAKPRRPDQKPARTAKLSADKPPAELTVIPRPKPKAVQTREARLVPQERPAKRQRPVQRESRIDCGKGAAIVGDYGFSDVRPKQCAGKEYVFEAMRDGETYSVNLSAANGELAKVAKQQRRDPEVWSQP